jgi:hypothetical protein
MSEERERKKSEQRVLAQEIHKNTRTILAKLIDCQGKTACKVLESVQKEVARIEQVKSVVPKEFRERMHVMHNVAGSLSQGIQDNVYGTENVLRFVTKSQQLLRELHEINTAAPVVRPQEDDDLDSNAFLDALEREVKTLNQKYTGYEQQLRRLADKTVILLRAPVIPITDPPLSPDRMSSLGFEIHNVGMYPVFENQILLGLHVSFLSEQVKKLRSGRKIWDTHTVAESVLPTIEARLKQGRLHIVGSHGVRHETGMFFWLMPDRQLSAIQRSARGVKIEQWGFAFNMPKSKVSHYAE